MATLFEDFDFVRPDMAVGGRVHPGVAKRLYRQFGIGHVVDLRAEDVDDVELLSRHGVRHLHLPTPDCLAVVPNHLWQGVHWVNEALAQGGKVLIHCEYGMGRSVLLAACVLVSQAHSPVDALQTIRQNRRQASPTRAQLQALLNWASEWCEKSLLPASTQSLHDLENLLHGRARHELFEVE